MMQIWIIKEKGHFQTHTLLTLPHFLAKTAKREFSWKKDCHFWIYGPPTSCKISEKTKCVMERQMEFIRAPPAQTQEEEEGW